MAAASLTNPVYTVNIKKSDGTTYKVKDIVTDLVLSHGKDDLSEKAVMSLMNVSVGGNKISTLVKLKDAVYIYANIGNGAEEVMRGIVWERAPDEDIDQNMVPLICYDNLIYFQKSKDNFFAKKGKKTEDLLKSIAKKWGFSITFKYKSISHGKLTFHNQYISDIFISILDEVKKQTGTDYVIRSEKGKIIIEAVGSNTTVYMLEEKKNVISHSYKESMEGLVTKVLIVKAETVSTGKGTEETGKYLTVTSVSKNTAKYGTLQEVLVKGKEDKLSDVKKEANQLLSDKATPKLEKELQAMDIPMLKKGHQVHINAGSSKGYFIVKAIEHDADKNIMYLEVEKYE